MKILRSIVPPLLGIAALLLVWSLLAKLPETSLPGPVRTWEASKLYVLHPLTKRGENDQGILLFAIHSLELVAKGYAISMIVAIPLGFAIGLSPFFSRLVDPIMQLFRPVSPLAWLPLGLVVFQSSMPAAIFTIAICAMWPTVLNIAVGVRSVPQEYLNVARVLKLPAWKTFVTILLPSTLPNMFAGFRISFGIAWLAIVAAEMLTGSPGLGGFLWQEYNALVYEHIILCIFAIGFIGLLLDRLLGLLERSFRSAGAQR
jgi:nitrate/nitrite transport system permease protein